MTVSLTYGAIETSVAARARRSSSWVTAGILPVLVNSPFQGVSPRAPTPRVVLEPLQTHSATFYGQSVQILGNAIVHSPNFDWSVVPGFSIRNNPPGNVHNDGGGGGCVSLPATPTPPATTPSNPLTASTVDSFIDWAGAAAQSQIPELESRVAAAASDPAVLAALTARLLAIPAGQVSDVARHLIIMSILGQMKNSGADAALVTFIGNDPVCGVPASDAGPSDAGEQGIPDTVADTGSLLRAKAVEMLAFIGDELALQATLNIAATHACKAVRIAAIDAYMFNNADSSAAKSQLMAVVHADEQKMIGIPRRNRVMDIAAFDQALQQFYVNNPGELPLVQDLLDASAPRPDSGFLHDQLDVCLRFGQPASQPVAMKSSSRFERDIAMNRVLARVLCGWYAHRFGQSFGPQMTLPPAMIRPIRKTRRFRPRYPMAARRFSTRPRVEQLTS